MKLAEKYAKPKTPKKIKSVYAQIRRKGKSDGWVAERDAWRRDADAECTQNVRDAIAERQVELATKIYAVAVKLIDKIDEDVEQRMNFRSIDHKNLTGALTDLAKLLKDDAETDTAKNNITITFGSQEMEEYGD